MSGPTGGGGAEPPAGRAVASRAGLLGALLGAGAAAAAIFALRPAQGGGRGGEPVGVLALQPGPGQTRLQPAPAVRHGGRGGAPEGGRNDPNRVGHGGDGRGRGTDHAERQPASKRIISGYGFWIFLLSDIIMFAAFFAAYAVLVGETAGGPAGRDLFDLRVTAVETACLLLSSFTCGLASIGVQARNGRWFYGAMAATFVLGAAFIALELREFASMVADGNGPARSAFLSAFFALVGLHGLHVSAGLLWLLTMMAQVFAKGYRADILRRVLCFSLFWHALDIIWVALFTVVYLMGAGA